MSQLVTFQFHGLSSLPVPFGASASRGTVPVVPVNDLATVDTSIFPIEFCLSQGLTVAAIVVATANRPTTNLVPGLQIMDSSLNTPIWRDCTNTKWISATGATV